MQNAAPVQGNSGDAGTQGLGGADAISNTLDYDDFLNLLIMQLRYQDPLNPLENSEFIAQNAQFSTVEQLISIKNQMASQAAALETANASYATSMIGKMVAADVSDYNEEGELEERYITGVVEEVTFIRSEGAVLVKLDNDALVYLSQIVSVREVGSE
jgi:flagellar basal-body rod modification protein FlgD